MKIKRNIGKLFTYLSKFKSISQLRPKISHKTLIATSTVALILLVSFVVRILPVRFGWSFNEFDPHVHYRFASVIDEVGYFDWVNQHDYQRWFPEGKDWSGYLPFLEMTGVTIYKFLKVVGGPYATFSLYDFCIFFPVIFGTLAVLVLYFLGKDVGGVEVGILSALFLALSKSHIGRTQIGWFDDESLAIFTMLLYTFFFLRSIEKDRNTLLYSILSGLTLAWTMGAWGASSYIIAITVIFTILMVFMRKYTTEMLFSYSVTFGLAFLVATMIPRLGIDYLFSFSGFMVLGGLGILLLSELRKQGLSLKWTYVTFIGGIVALIFASFTFESIGGKILRVLNPALRTESQIFISVAEHKMSAWGTMYYEFGILIFFALVGLFFMIRDFTPKKLFMMIFMLTSLYFTASLIRLSILLAPAFLLVSAIGITSLLKPFTILYKKATTTFEARKGVIGKEFSGITILMIFLLLTIGFFRIEAFDQANVPTTLMSSSIPTRQQVPAWYDALMWMKTELPDDAVVCAWWDYGYWITIMANKTTLADNGTTNTTRISQIGEMFLSNETDAIEILQKLRATHVLVFSTWTEAGEYRGYGEESKWVWMSRISGQNQSNYGGYDDKGRWEWNDVGQQTVLYQMMESSWVVAVEKVDDTLEYFDLVFVSLSKTYGGTVPLIGVFEINYGVSD